MAGTRGTSTDRGSEEEAFEEEALRERGAVFWSKNLLELDFFA
jgi:hypothetical protein